MSQSSTRRHPEQTRTTAWMQEAAPSGIYKSTVHPFGRKGAVAERAVILSKREACVEGSDRLKY